MLTRYAIYAALTASVAAAGLFWLWSEAREANAALRAENRSLEKQAEQLGAFLTSERELNIRLTDSIEGLANVPDTDTCVGSPSIDVLPGLLRNQRGNP